MCINKKYDAGHTENYEKIKLITNMITKLNLYLPLSLVYLGSITRELSCMFINEEKYRGT